ncbi:MAG: Trypsin-like peptidase domain protein [Candidatus Udaeobacter sp.]|nr:MAG: Trypsin-like peptidase domain protein [Candidatus Udaeobacter sp.]
MSRLSDFRHGRVGRASRGLRVPVSQVKNLRLFMSRKAAFALIFCLSAGSLFAQEQPAKTTSEKTKEMFERALSRAESATAISHQIKDVFARAAKAVVKIHGVDEHSEICGTGFFIDPTGTLYTAYTVGGEAGNFTIEFGGRKYPARQLLADIRSGTAMLKIDEATPALPIGKSEQLEVATPVVSIGFPLDLPETPNFGMVAGFDRKYLGRYFSTTHMRLNLPSQRGEAGAPLLNMKGEVVGIVVSSLENNSACYAVPIEAAEKIRADFMRFGEARHGWVGINVSMARQPVEGSLAEMTQIMQDTPAARSGIKAGDILLQVGRKKVTQPEDVLDASFFITAGDVVPITVMRGTQKLTFSVQATLHPASRTGLLLAAPGTPAMNQQAIPLSLGSDVPPTP